MAVAHPASAKLRRDTLDRFLKMRDLQDEAIANMRVGLLLRFSAVEREILVEAGMLSARDQVLLASTRTQRRPQWLK